jgi:hypothetical protein
MEDVAATIPDVVGVAKGDIATAHAHDATSNATRQYAHSTVHDAAANAATGAALMPIVVWAHIAASDTQCAATTAHRETYATEDYHDEVGRTAAQTGVVVPCALEAAPAAAVAWEQATAAALGLRPHQLCVQLPPRRPDLGRRRRCPRRSGPMRCHRRRGPLFRHGRPPNSDPSYLRRCWRLPRRARPRPR